MKTLDDLIGNFNSLLGDLDTITEKEIETVATDGLFLLDNRVTTTGEGPHGPLPQYTEPYRKKKEKAGRFRGFVDLTFTGQMWASIGIVERKAEGQGFVVVIGGRDTETQRKMEGNQKARPGVFDLKKEEVGILRDDSEDRLSQTIASYLQ